MNPEEELFGKVVSECNGCLHVTSSNCCEIFTQPERQWIYSEKKGGKRECQNRMIRSEF